jgi:hypothetical protein
MVLVLACKPTEYEYRLRLSTSKRKIPFYFLPGGFLRLPGGNALGGSGFI